MNALPVVTCRHEGGLYTPDRDPAAPIRIYEDGTIEDDYTSFEREQIGAERLAEIKEAAQQNRHRGLV